MFDELGARDDSTGVMHQVSEQAVFVARELDRVAIDRHSASASVEPHRSTIEFALGMASRAAQKRTYARQHLFQMKGFGDVVVRARIEALYLVAPAITRGEHEHGHCAPGAAPGFQYGNAVHFRQANIEDHSIVGFGLPEIMTLFAVERAIDDISGVGQRSGELAIEIGVILDHEEAQGIFLRLAAGMILTIYGVNSRVDHFATAAEQSQYIDEFTVVSAKVGTNNFGILAMFAQKFDGLGQRNCLVCGNRGALFGLGQARFAVWCVSSADRDDREAEQQGREKKSGNRHRWGVSGVPVNAS